MTNLIPLKTAAQISWLSEIALKKLYYSKSNNYRIAKIDDEFYAVEGWERGGALVRDIEKLYYEAAEMAGSDWSLAKELSRLHGGKTLAYYRYLQRFASSHFDRALRFREELISFIEATHG